MKSVSSNYKRKVNALGADEAELLLLEISHPSLTDPARIVNDNQDLTHNGNVFTALGFRYKLPDDLKAGQPRATLSIDNVGRDLTQVIESTAGGRDADVRMLLVLRSDPDVVEWETTMQFKGTSMTTPEITGQLGHDDILKKSGVPLTYRPDTAPGLF